MKRHVLHLVRTAGDEGRVPREALGKKEKVACIDELTAQELLEQIFAHELAVLW